MTRPLGRSALIALVLALCVTGCAAGAGDPSPVPSPSPSSSPAPEPATFDRVDLECDEVESPDELSDVLGTAVAPRDPLATYSGASGMIPRLAYVLAAGGLVCEWSNGVANAPVLGTPPDYIGIEVQVLPVSAEEWNYFAEYYGITGTRIEHCDGLGCTLDDYTNGYWTSVMVHGEMDPTAMAERLRQVVQVVAPLPSPDPYVAPPTDFALAQLACDDYLSAEDVQAAIRTSAPLEVEGEGGGWSLWASALVTVGGGWCGFSGASQHVGVLTMAGGAATADATLAVSTAPSVPQPLEVDGATSGTIRCGSDEAQCIVDLIIGGHWMQVVAEDYDPASSARTSREVAIELAQVLALRATAGS